MTSYCHTYWQTALLPYTVYRITQFMKMFPHLVIHGIGISRNESVQEGKVIQMNQLDATMIY